MPDIRGHRPRGALPRAAAATLAAAVLAGVLLMGSASSGVAAGSTTEDPAASAPGFPWAWPVPGPRTVVEPFRAPAHAYGPGHRGMDIAAPLGEQVRSPADGIIAFRGVVVDRPLVTIDHGSGHVTTLEPVESSLAPGDRVEAGEAVGTVSSGGHAARGTLHVGVRVDEAYVNPRPLFGSVPRAVLLPCCE